MSLVALLGVLVALATASYAVWAASGKADFSLSASPSSQSVAQGASASYSVTMTPINGFSGQVTLSVSGLPTGASGSFSRNPVSPNTKTCSSCQTSTLTVNTAATTPTGSYTLTIKGVSGSLSHTTTVTLVVTASTSTSTFSLSASPSSATVAAGTSAIYTVSLSRTNFTANVTLSASGLPAGAAASFNPNPIAGPTGSSSTLTVSTSSATTPDGSYTLTITGTGGSPAVTKTTTVTLVISTPSGGTAFTIAGNLTVPFYPGVSQALNLSLTNPNNFDLSITNLTVAVQVTNAPNATPAHPCSASDFPVTQFSGAYPFTLLSGRTATLSQLGFASTQWPQVKMLDTSSNQDGCKNATLKLNYTGTTKKAGT